MKSNFLVFLILLSITSFAQKTKFEGENVNVSFDDQIESEKISIRFFKELGM